MFTNSIVDFTLNSQHLVEQINSVGQNSNFTLQSSRKKVFQGVTTCHQKVKVASIKCVSHDKSSKFNF